MDETVTMMTRVDDSRLNGYVSVQSAREVFREGWNRSDEGLSVDELGDYGGMRDSRESLDDAASTFEKEGYLPFCRPLISKTKSKSKRQKEPLIGDRKSTRLNSSHRCISYAVFCLKKKTN